LSRFRIYISLLYDGPHVVKYKKTDQFYTYISGFNPCDDNRGPVLFFPRGMFLLDNDVMCIRSNFRQIVHSYIIYYYSQYIMADIFERNGIIWNIIIIMVQRDAHVRRNALVRNL